MTPSILVVAGSTRSGSINGKLADAAQLALAQFGGDVTRISLLDYPLPLVNEDLKKQGYPRKRHEAWAHDCCARWPVYRQSGI